jgi:hypothetical protein
VICLISRSRFCRSATPAHKYILACLETDRAKLDSLPGIDNHMAATGQKFPTTVRIEERIKLWFSEREG